MCIRDSLSREGEVYPLTTSSPALIRRMLEASWQEQQAETVAAKMGVSGVDMNHAKAALADKRFDQQDRTLLASYVTQSIWTKLRLQNARCDADTT
eukprot:735246-Pyramimonas_sp.AAC.1